MCLRGRFNLCRERRVIGIHCSGGFAEQVLVPERNLYDRPRSLDPLQAALAEPFANAVHVFVYSWKTTGCRGALELLVVGC